jgi:uncharacterized protein (TIGR03437 family)
MKGVMKLAVFSLVSWLINPVFGQVPAIVTSMGYSAPAPTPVAPGQVVTLFVHTKTKLAQPIVADTSAPAFTLGGFKVSLAETFSTPGSVSVPILSAAPIERCSGVVPALQALCTYYTAITVQIPFELVPNVPGSRLPENFAALTVSDNSDSGEPIALSPVSDQIHILNSCDTPLNPRSGPCGPVLLHSDGSLVSTGNPAMVGESITMQAYGLGYADSPVTTGMPSPSPAAAVSGVSIGFIFDGSAAKFPPANAPAVAAQLVPGSVGLYRMTFVVPGLPDGTAACTPNTTNLTVVVGRGVSFDGAGLCAVNAQ